ncbi:hypothetical protein BD769DRAFT_1392170 [Suillus cothurnatus]|nr:hypothetical protein BD769DRAFT_1392170 [Suillus cothurnatus]
MYTGNPDLWQPSFNDEDEALLIAAAEPVEAHEDNTVVSDISISIPEDIPGTPHSHDVEPCLGDRGHGQGLPAYPCGCYIRPKVDFGPALTDSDGVDSWNAQVGGRSGGIWPLPVKHKTLESELTFELDPIGDITTPHRFGQHLTNVPRAQSMPALEMPKRRKLGKAFEINGRATQTHESLVVDVVKHLEAAIDKQTETETRRTIRMRSELGSSVLELQNLLSSLTEVGLVRPDPVQECRALMTVSCSKTQTGIEVCDHYELFTDYEWVWHPSWAKWVSLVLWAIFALVTPSLLPGGLYIIQFLRYYPCDIVPAIWNGQDGLRKWSLFYLGNTMVATPLQASGELP